MLRIVVMMVLREVPTIAVHRGGAAAAIGKVVMVVLRTSVNHLRGVAIVERVGRRSCGVGGRIGKTTRLRVGVNVRCHCRAVRMKHTTFPKRKRGRPLSACPSVCHAF